MESVDTHIAIVRNVFISKGGVIRYGVTNEFDPIEYIEGYDKVIPEGSRVLVRNHRITEILKLGSLSDSYYCYSDGFRGDLKECIEHAKVCDYRGYLE